MTTDTASRIGVLGGTFNPVHVGHQILAQEAAEAFDLARVLFIPCAVPPHKPTSVLAPADHRLAMVESAIEGDLRFESSDIEIKRGGVSYAIDTLRELHQQYSDARFFFIIGADTLRELHLWKDIAELLGLCTFVSFGRPGHEPAPQAVDLKLDPPWPERLMRNYVAARMIDISSSDIRHRTAEGLSVRYLVPAGVEMYIAEHGLYVK